MAVPALRALRRRFPKAELFFQGKGPFESLLGDSGLFDRFIPLQSGEGRRKRNIEEIRQLEVDLAVILPHSFGSALEIWRAGVPIRLGYAREGRLGLLTHSLPPHQTRSALLPVPMHYQYLELMSVLGADGDAMDGLLGVSAEAEAAGTRWLLDRGIPEGESPIAFNPGASFGPSKIYPPHLLAEVGRQILERELGPLLILCGPGEEELAREVGGHLTVSVPNAAEDPPPLDVLKAILKRCRVLVTMDSGPRHLAVALSVPTVVLMGPTDPRFTAARLEQSIVLRKPVPCGPCHQKICPLDHRCMHEISSQEVFAATESLLGDEASAQRLGTLKSS